MLECFCGNYEKATSLAETITKGCPSGCMQFYSETENLAQSLGSISASKLPLNYPFLYIAQTIQLCLAVL